ncbi:MAG: hypothetical protein GX638_08875, partial [Crenarchaeota archaeon]|nr:hypothetical protein [Thermoproteota archaeon]
ETISNEESVAVKAPQKSDAPNLESSEISTANTLEVIEEKEAQVQEPTKTPTENGASIQNKPLEEQVNQNEIADDLTKVKGIGQKRANQLRSYGITSVSDLSKVEVADIAKKLNVSPKIVEKWVEAAKNLIK